MNTEIKDLTNKLLKEQLTTKEKEKLVAYIERLEKKEQNVLKYLEDSIAINEQQKQMATDKHSINYYRIVSTTFREVLKKFQK